MNNWLAKFQKWRERFSEWPQQLKFFDEVYVDSERHRRQGVCNKWHQNGGILLLGYRAFVNDL